MPMKDNEREFARVTTRFFRELVPEAARAVASQLFIAGLRGIVERTPVHYGFLRGRWQAQVGSIPSSTTKRADKSGADTIRRGTAVAVKAPAYTIMYLANNSPQVIVAERGGWVPPNPKTDEESLKRRAAGRTRVERKRAELIGGNPGAPLIKGGYSLQSPTGMVGVTVIELRSKANQIAKSASARVRRGGGR